jgi:hypothetical protein
VGDDADPAALAVAGEVALDVDGGAGQELGEVGGVEGREDDPVAINPLAGGVALGEQEETDLAVSSDGSWEAGHQADETSAVHCGIATSVPGSSMRCSSMEAASVKAAAPPGRSASSTWR